MTVPDSLKALGVTALWGINFSFIKLGVAHVEPLPLAGLRFLLCALPLIFFVPRPTLPWRWVVGYGLAFGVGTWGLMTLALRAGVAPGAAAWLLQSSAFLTPLLAWAWLREALSAAQRRGMAIAFGGFALVLSQGSAGGSVGLLLVMAAALSLSLANVIVRRAGTPPAQVLGLMVWASPFAALPLLGAALLQQGPQLLLELPAALAAPQAWGSLLFQVYPVTLFGYAVWNRLILRHGAGRVAPVALMVPIWAVAFALLIFGQAPTALQGLGMGLIGLGLLVGGGLSPARLAARLRPAR
jgi:O-acetylserine/cysteine efflux transporter